VQMDLVISSRPRLCAAVLLILCGAFPITAAESAICSVGAEGTLEGSLALRNDQIDPESRAALAKPITHLSVLALVVISSCPGTSERVLGRDKDSAATLFGSLEKDMESVVPAGAVRSALALLSERVHCDAATPGLCIVRDRLRHLAGTKLQNETGHGVCEVLGYRLTDGLAGDLAEADGAYIMGRTQDLATLLSLCPEQFFEFMHSHHAALDAWLRESERFLFLADEPYKADLDNYRTELIDCVQRSIRKGSYTDEKQVTLSHLLSNRIKIIQ
jgi:hypothetical protein